MGLCSTVRLFQYQAAQASSSVSACCLLGNLASRNLFKARKRFGKPTWGWKFLDSLGGCVPVCVRCGMSSQGIMCVSHQVGGRGVRWHVITGRMCCSFLALDGPGCGGNSDPLLPWRGLLFLRSVPFSGRSFCDCCFLLAYAPKSAE